MHLQAKQEFGEVIAISYLLLVEDDSAVRVMRIDNCPRPMGRNVQHSD